VFHKIIISGFSARGTALLKKTDFYIFLTRKQHKPTLNQNNLEQKTAKIRAKKKKGKGGVLGCKPYRKKAPSTPREPMF
jgi:hypothetical protein